MRCNSALPVVGQNHRISRDIWIPDSGQNKRPTGLTLGDHSIKRSLKRTHTHSPMEVNVLIWLYLIIRLVNSVALDLGPLIANRSSPLQNNSLTFPECVNSGAWASTRFHPSDCQLALDRFTVAELVVSRSSHKNFEFLGIDATPVSTLTTQTTPRRYVYNTCTMAIILQKDLPSLSPIAPGHHPSPPTDFATYSEIWEVTSILLRACISPILISKRSSDLSRVRFVSMTGWNRVVSSTTAAGLKFVD